MSNVFRCRLTKLEVILKLKSEKAFTVLNGPSLEATAAQRQECHQMLEKARIRGDRIGVVLAPGRSAQDWPQAGVEYFESNFHAELAVMASQKSQEGRANRLADVLASLNGRVLGVRRESEYGY